MARTLDQVVVDTLGLKEMTIARLVCQVEDLKAQLEAAQASKPDAGDAMAALMPFAGTPTTTQAPRPARPKPNGKETPA